MFVIERNGNKIELDVIEKSSNYSVIIDAFFNGEKIANKTKAHICKMLEEPHKLYLGFNSLNNKRIMLLICDRSLDHNDFRNIEEVEENRKISNWIWENLFKQRRDVTIYNFTTEHWQNWEN